MDVNDDKITAQHADAVEIRDNTVHVDGADRETSISSQDADEQIIHHLQTTGEEVGMTWRTFMAAIVCFFRYPCLANGAD